MTQTDRPARASIVSGYFNPLHTGHLDLFEAARERTGYLVVIVNNDVQQVLKKGKVIQPEADRLRIVRSLRMVDDALLAVEDGPGLDGSFDLVRAAYAGHRAGVLQRRRPQGPRQPPGRGGRGGPPQRHPAGLRHRRLREGGLQLADQHRARPRRSMTTFPQVLARRLADDPGRPLVTFYDDATGERTELSVATWANWVAKVSSLLVEELDVEHGSRSWSTCRRTGSAPSSSGAAWACGIEVVWDGRRRCRGHRPRGAGALGARGRSRSRCWPRRCSRWPGGSPTAYPPACTTSVSRCGRSPTGTPRSRPRRTTMPRSPARARQTCGGRPPSGTMLTDGGRLLVGGESGFPFRSRLPHRAAGTQRLSGPGRARLRGETRADRCGRAGHRPVRAGRDLVSSPGRSPRTRCRGTRGLHPGRRARQGVQPAVAPLPDDQVGMARRLRLQVTDADHPVVRREVDLIFSAAWRAAHPGRCRAAATGCRRVGPGCPERRRASQRPIADGRAVRQRAVHRVGLLQAGGALARIDPQHATARLAHQVGEPVSGHVSDRRELADRAEPGADLACSASRCPWPSPRHSTRLPVERLG